MTSTLGSDTRSKIEQSPAEPGDHDRFSHYFYKEAVNRNLLTGEPMTALCGKVVAQQVDPKGRTLCPECEQIMAEVVGSNLPEGERGDAPGAL